MIRSFFTRNDGSVAIMTGLMLATLVTSVAIAIDFTNAVKVKAQVQRISDGATVIAARTYRDTEDRKLALESAGNYFDNAMTDLAGTKYENKLSVKRIPGTNDIKAVNESDLEIDNLIVAAGLPSAMKAKLIFKTKLAELPQDLYLVLLVDASNSMHSLIDSVRLAITDLEQEVRNGLLAKGVDIGRIYVKAAFFSDLRYDVSPEAWVESPVYNLGVPEETTAFRDFVAAQTTSFGYDNSEYSPAAIAPFLTAPMPAKLKAAETVQAIVVWTDAPGLPLDHATYTHDTTVNLYKAHGELGRSGEYLDAPEQWGHNQVRDAEYDETALYDGDATGGEPSPPSYGCCSSMSVFEDRWRNAGTVALERRMLGMIVPSRGPRPGWRPGRT